MYKVLKSYVELLVSKVLLKCKNLLVQLVCKVNVDHLGGEQGYCDVKGEKVTT